jgi:PGF-CTERM protein
MEQNVRTFGVIFATLALIASVLVMPNVSATDGDIQTSITGDDGLTSYASSFGHATFTAAISSASGDGHTNVIVSASFPDGSGWAADAATISDCSGAGTTGSNNTGDLAAGATNTVCISVSVEASGSEIGDDVEMTVSVTTDEDTTGTSTNVAIKISDWRASSDDPVQSYAEGDTNTYTISIENIKLDVNGDGVAIDDPTYLTLSNADEGWNIDSDNSAWDKLELTATINYIAAGGTFDLELDIQLVGGIIPASSYINSNSNIVFSVNDDAGVYSLVTLEAEVADNFALNSVGSGNEYVDNGCGDDTATLGWTPSIHNFGNTLDSFEVTFDTSDADAAGWSIDGANGFNTGNLLPKFEEGSHSFNVGLHVPGGLAAGTSHGFSMTITSDNDPTWTTQTQTFSATVNQCYGLTLAADKTTDSANPGSSIDYTMTVTNTGNGEDTIDYQTMGAAEWAPTLSESSSTVASGDSAQVVFSLTIPTDASANAQSGMAMVHAYSEACGEDKTDCDYEQSVSVSATANQVYDISVGYYSNETSVVKDTASAQEGMSVQMKFILTNSGNGNDEVTLSLANAPSWVTLGQTEALVGPGQAPMTLNIDVAAPSSDARGDHTFQVVATSADGTTTSTTGDLTVTVIEKTTDGTGPTTDKVDEDDSPGFGILSVVAALGAVLLLRRRS